MTNRHHPFTYWRKSTHSGNNDCIEIGIPAPATWRKSSHSGNGGACIEVGTANLAASTWRKSTHSGNGGNCVEMAATHDVVGVRDSKDPDGPVLALSRRDWARLVGTLKAIARP